MKIAALCALALGVSFTPARADSFGSGGNAFTIDFVTIGNAGNADDAGAGGGLYSTPFGGVSYGYRMGTYEISQDAITKATAGAWGASQPAANMTWFEAAAFVNWLNDQRTPELKAYNLTGATSLTPWASVDAWQLGGENLYRHKDAYYFLPSEDEWYKAAYHKNDGVTANYWDYATGSNSIPTEVASGTTAGTAVYNGVTGSPAAVNNDGGLSAYGTSARVRTGEPAGICTVVAGREVAGAANCSGPTWARITALIRWTGADFTRVSSLSEVGTRDRGHSASGQILEISV